MKKMKSFCLGLCVMCCGIGLLAACAPETQVVTYRAETEEDGICMVDTMVLEAKDDKVEKMTETIELDYTSLDAETQEVLCNAYDELAAAYRKIEGVESTGTSGEGTYTLTVIVDMTGDAVSQLAEQGLLEVEGNSEGVSLKHTRISLEEEGYLLME